MHTHTHWCYMHAHKCTLMLHAYNFVLGELYAHTCKSIQLTEHYVNDTWCPKERKPKPWQKKCDIQVSVSTQSAMQNSILTTLSSRNKIN